MLSQKNKPNILLISLDTVRADHLSCYGYSKSTTPNIDRLAENGTLFEHAYSNAVWTPPAHASMLTGLYPSEHGVVDQNRLDSDIPTIAQNLLSNGYRTAGFVSNSQVGQLVGLDKGHETFVEIWRGSQSKNIILRALRWFGRKALDIACLRDHGAKITNQLALKWLDEAQRGDKPFYLFLHYIDAHSPLKAPRPYRTKFISKGLIRKIDQQVVKLMADNPLRFYSSNIIPNQFENEYLVGLYDGEIGYLDKKIGEIAEYLKKEKLYDNTLIIITADHGEHFGEHGHYSHVSSLYQPIIHVPLIIKLPGSAAKGDKNNKIVQLIDIFPTILNVAGITSEINDHISGQEIFNCNSTSEDHYVVSEWEGRIPYFILSDLKCDRTDERVSRFTKKIYSLIKGNYKYIVCSDGTEEIYNLVDDPEERINLVAQDGSLGKLYGEFLQKWKEQLKPNKVLQETYTLDKEIEKNLKALGYL